MAEAVVITSENEKGGVGKTSLVVTVAVGVAAALKNARVLIVDTDPQGSVAKALALQPDDRCLSNILLAEEVTPELVADNIMLVDSRPVGGPLRSNLYLLPASARLADALLQIRDDSARADESARGMSPVMRRRLGMDNIPTLTDIFLERMSLLLEDYAFILIDTPPSLGPLREGLRAFADFALVPTSPDFLSTVQTPEHTRKIIADLEAGLRTRILAVVPSKVKTGHNLTTQMLSELNDAYGDLVTPPIPDTTYVAQAPALGGLTIFENAPKNSDAAQAAAKAYAAVVWRVLKTREQVPA